MKQYDFKFKKRAAKAMVKIRESGVRGDITRLAAQLDVPRINLTRWERLYTSGILKKSNALSFSANPSTMIRG
jgi:hypothetical protein